MRRPWRGCVTGCSADRQTRAVTRSPYAVRELAVVVAVLELGLILLSPYYGPHRDELYFVTAGQHLSWGYPDQPSLTPLLAGLADLIAPHNLTVLRIPSILAVVGTVLLTAQAARLLGGGRAAQVLAAVLVGFSTVTLGLGHMLSTATLDMLLWTAVLTVVLQALLDDRPRLWLLAGAIAGVGLNNKHLILFCLLGVLVGVAVVAETRPVLRTRWPWLGGLVALAMWLPNLIWQARHDWPVFALSGDIADEYGGVLGRLGMVFEALIMFSPLIAVVWIAGIVELMRRPEWLRARPIAIAFLTLLGILLITGGKGYYFVGAIPVLLAAGTTVLVERLTRRRVHEQHTTRRIVAAGAILIATTAPAYPAMIPLVPASVFADSPWSAINDVQGDTVGWPEYAGQVQAVVDRLNDSDRENAVIFTSNYGEAGAMSWYDVGLPVYSGHNGYRNWGPPPEDARPVVVVYPVHPSDAFEGCRLQLQLSNDAGVDNEEVGAGVYVCRGPKGGWAAAWEDLAHYDA